MPGVPTPVRTDAPVRTSTDLDHWLSQQHPPVAPVRKSDTVLREAALLCQVHPHLSSLSPQPAAARLAEIAVQDGQWGLTERVRPGEGQDRWDLTLRLPVQDGFLLLSPGRMSIYQLVSNEGSWAPLKNTHDIDRTAVYPFPEADPDRRTLFFTPLHTLPDPLTLTDRWNRLNSPEVKRTTRRASLDLQTVLAGVGALLGGWLLWYGSSTVQLGLFMLGLSILIGAACLVLSRPPGEALRQNADRLAPDLLWTPEERAELDALCTVRRGVQMDPRAQVDPQVPAALPSSGAAPGVLSDLTTPAALDPLPHTF